MDRMPDVIWILPTVLRFFVIIISFEMTLSAPYNTHLSQAAGFINHSVLFFGGHEETVAHNERRDADTLSRRWDAHVRFA